MRIVKLSNESIIRFNKGHGWLIRSKHNSLELVRECKAIMPNGLKVFFCKLDGSVEPSYSTLRQYPDTSSEELMRCIEG